MRYFHLLIASLLNGFVLAGTCTLRMNAPGHAGEALLLFRYADLFTLREELLGTATIDAKGEATITAEISGTMKAELRIGAKGADLFLRDGAHYDIVFPRGEEARNPTAKVDLEFLRLDRMDINALTADLNGRLDDFIAEDLATDQGSGMEAVDRKRKADGMLHADTAKHPATLFNAPTWKGTRVDTFETKLRKFYAEVKDPWFAQELDYGLAGLRLGPRASDRALFDKYLKGKPVLYGVPEYTRFVNAFFTDHIMRFPFKRDEAALLNAVQQARTDSVKKLFAKHDFLRDDDRLCELVLMTQLWTQYPGKTFDRAGILKMFGDLARSSAYEEHRRIAANMLWDLTAMRAGSRMPELAMWNSGGQQAALDTMLHGTVYLALVRNNCGYCDEEMIALEKLKTEYGRSATFITVLIGANDEATRAYAKKHPAQDAAHVFGCDAPDLMDQLRIRTLPSFFLLNDGVLDRTPAPPPSNGLAAVLYRLKAQWEQRHKLMPADGAHAPKRR